MKSLFFFLLCFVSTSLLAQSLGVGVSVGSHNLATVDLKIDEKLSIIASGNTDMGSLDAVYHQCSWLSYGAGINGVESEATSTTYKQVWVQDKKKSNPKYGHWENVEVNSSSDSKINLGLRLPVMVRWNIPKHPICLFAMVVPIMTFELDEYVVEAGVGARFYFK
jgi:hypothetical protein